MKKFLCNPRLLLGLFLLCGIVLLAALLFFSPVQGPVVLYKVALVVVAAIAGMTFDFFGLSLCLAVVLSGQGLAERPGRHGR